MGWRPFLPVNSVVEAEVRKPVLRLKALFPETVVPIQSKRRAMNTNGSKRDFAQAGVVTARRVSVICVAWKTAQTT